MSLKKEEKGTLIAFLNYKTIEKMQRKTHTHHSAKANQKHF
jgi:hypothetical protein